MSINTKGKKAFFENRYRQLRDMKPDDQAFVDPNGDPWYKKDITGDNKDSHFLFDNAIEKEWQVAQAEAAANTPAAKEARQKAAQAKALADYQRRVAPLIAEKKEEAAYQEWKKKYPTRVKIDGNRSATTRRDFRRWTKREEERKADKNTREWQRKREEHKVRKEEEAAEAARIEAIRQKEKLARYAQNIQSFLYREMDTLKKFYEENLDKEKTKTENIHRLADTVPDGAFNTYFSGQQGLGAFVNATPAQLALLMPLMRFFIVDQSGNDREIYFSDYTTEAYSKKIADLRSGGDIQSVLSPRSQRGSDAGIRSFSWNYNNKHEGDYIIDAQMELYFGTLAELANINYLQFLFPTGNAVELAEDLTTTSENLSDAERKKPLKPYREKTRSDRLTDLQKKINAQTKILRSSAADAEKIPKIVDKDAAAERKKEFRQLKVVVGWSLPKGNRQQLMSLFPDKPSMLAFESGILATQKAIFLNLADYNVDFSQEGPATLSLRYIGSSDNYMATAGSDIFGSNNFKSSESTFLYKPTKVSLAGIGNNNGKIIDLRNTKIEAGDLNAVKDLKDPYIESKMSTLAKNRFDEPTIEVTLGGLKKSQELATLKLKKLELMNVDDSDENMERIRRSAQFVTLMYDRAADIRLRDIYSRFLDSLLDSDYVHQVTVAPPDQSDQPPTITATSTTAESQRKFEEVERVLSGAAGPDLPPPDPNNTDIYFMRFGDIVRRAMEISDCRDDISFIMGNAERYGINHSLYDIPITINTFGQFFYNAVVSRKRKFYPFRYFLNDLLKTIAAVINQDPTIMNKIAFDWTLVSARRSPVRNLPFVLNTNQLRRVRNAQDNPLSVGGKYQHFYPIYTTNISFGNKTGDRDLDAAEGIYHYVIGSDRGLAKEFNFSRQDTQYFQEMLIESNNLDDKIQALFLPQNVSITMFGNTLHKNGDLIFVDSRPSLGSFAGPVLGIGGYYRVVRSTHSISNRGYETTLECVFELRVSPDKTDKKD